MKLIMTLSQWFKKGRVNATSLRQGHKQFHIIKGKTYNFKS